VDKLPTSGRLAPAFSIADQLGDYYGIPREMLRLLAARVAAEVVIQVEQWAGDEFPWSWITELVDETDWLEE
jgi:hypothetical protein